jgi:hypothetical protein
MDKIQPDDLLTEAITHARAGLTGLEAARTQREKSGSLYPTHVHVAAVELAHAIEVAMRAALLEG